MLPICDPNALNGVLGRSTIGEEGRSDKPANEAGVGVADLERGGLTVHGPTVPARQGREGVDRGMEILECRFGLADLICLRAVKPHQRVPHQSSLTLSILELSTRLKILDAEPAVDDGKRTTVGIYTPLALSHTLSFWSFGGNRKFVPVRKSWRGTLEVIALS